MAAAAKRTGRTPKTRARTTAKRDWKPEFLAAFERTGLVTEACKIAEVGRSTVYEQRDQDQAFAAAWADLEEAVVERMEAEALRRAVDGVESDHFDKDGNLLWTERKFSDTLMIFLLKARKPEMYRERLDHRHTGPAGGPLEHEVALDSKSRELIDALLARRADARSQ